MPEAPVTKTRRWARLSAFIPHLPGRAAALPELFEQLPLAHGVHGLPESLVAKGHQLSIRGELLQRVSFPDRVIALDVVERCRLEHEESAIDPPAFRLRLLGEFDHAVAIVDDAA